MLLVSGPSTSAAEPGYRNAITSSLCYKRSLAYASFEMDKKAECMRLIRPIRQCLLVGPGVSSVD